MERMVKKNDTDLPSPPLKSWISNQIPNSAFKGTCTIKHTPVHMPRGLIGLPEARKNARVERDGSNVSVCLGDKHRS